MPDRYPILKIDPGMVIAWEHMGSKRKFWHLAPGNSNSSWLFKFPNERTGEHWAEKIAAEIASVLGIEHARVELAEFEGILGSTTKSFVKSPEQLIHGNQLLSRVFLDYDPARTFHQSSHTLSNIWMTLDHVFIHEEGRKGAKRRLSEFIVLDALIGNTDRHHENWGVLRRQIEGRTPGRVSPSFDHASSLGRELPDRHRNRILREQEIGTYSERARGAIYWSEDERRCPSPLGLVRKAADAFPNCFRPGLLKLAQPVDSALLECVDRVPDMLMGQTARRFSASLIRYNLEALRRIVG